MATVAGMDIGGTKIRWVVVRDGRVTASREVRTPRRKDAFLAALRWALAELHRRGARRIGIGFPGTTIGTVLVSAHNLPFISRIDLRRMAPRTMKFRIDNDARCFARAEAVRGAGRNERRLLAVIIGTGVGRAVAHGKNVVRLVRFNHAERWERRYQARIPLPPRPLALFLGKELSGLVRDVKPTAVVMGGGVMRKPNFFALLRRAMKKNGVRIPIRRSHFRQNAGALGAALFA